MAAFDKIKVGDVLYDVHRHKVGNVRGMSQLGCWPVEVKEVDTERQRALCVWNHNASRARWWSRRELERLRRSRPGEKKRPAATPPVDASAQG